MHGAIYVQDSGNGKLSKAGQKIDSTYASIKATCPNTCELKKSGSCYAMSAHVGMHVRRLDKRARQHSPLKLARAEAAAIDASYKGGKVPAGRDLRIHSAGDSRTVCGTRIIAAAVKRWKARNGGDAYTYTHAFAHVHRKEWGCVSVLASIESTSQVAAARAAGYPVAIVVSEHTTDKAHTLPGSDTVFIPCPAQTRPKEVSCVSCRLCMKGDWLFATNRGISFAAHGVKTGALKKHLKVIA